MPDNAATVIGLVGNIGEFKLNSGDCWSSYVKRVKAYFLVNDIKPNVQTAYLITLIGNDTYDLLTDLCSPEEPESKGFEDLVTLVDNHLNPKSSEVAERMSLHATTLGIGERISFASKEIGQVL